MMRRMRVLIEGGAARDSALVAAALAGNGFTLAERGTPFDLRLTLGAVPDRHHVGEIAVDLFRRQVTRGGRPLKLSQIEFAILACLIRAGHALSRFDLLREVWGYAFDPGTNLVAVHVSRLRAKLGSGVVVSAGGGYRIAE